MWSEKAGQYHASGLNCAQAVAKALAEMHGIDDTDGIVRMTKGFGGGGGNREGTCGALAGALLIESMTGSTKSNAEISNEFMERCGAIVCKTIKGTETGKVLCSCRDCVKNAVAIAANEG